MFPAGKGLLRSGSYYEGYLENGVPTGPGKEVSASAEEFGLVPSAVGWAAPRSISRTVATVPK